MNEGLSGMGTDEIAKSVDGIKKALDSFPTPFLFQKDSCAADISP